MFGSVFVKSNFDLHGSPMQWELLMGLCDHFGVSPVPRVAVFTTNKASLANERDHRWNNCNGYISLAEANWLLSL